MTENKGGETLGSELSSFSFPDLLMCLREDWVANRRFWSKPGFHAVAVYRFGVWIRGLPKWLRYPLTVVYRILFTFVRNVYGVELPRNAQVGRRLRIPHQGGIVISPQAVIGDDCLIRQNVTIGRFNRGRRRSPPYAPTIGNGVEIGAGAVVVGGITVGDGARIGPNAVVLADVPPGGSAFAPPSKVMTSLREAEEVEPDEQQG